MSEMPRRTVNDDGDERVRRLLPPRRAGQLTHGRWASIGVHRGTQRTRQAAASSVDSPALSGTTLPSQGRDRRTRMLAPIVHRAPSPVRGEHGGRRNR